MSLGQLSMWQHVKVNRACDICKMDQIAERAVIQFLHKKGLAPKTIYTDIVATLGKDVPLYATVQMWVAEFKRGRRALTMTPVLEGPSLLQLPK